MPVRLTDQTILVGPGSAGAPLADELAQRGWARVCVVSSRSAARCGQLEMLRSTGLAGTDVVAVHAGVASHAPVADTERLAGQLRGVDLDAIVALGGGSVSDMAKGVAVLLSEGGRLEDHCYTFVPPDDYRPKPLDAPKLPLVAVPTTLSGAELNGGAGATTDAGVKRAVWDLKLAARVGVYDAELLALTPPDLLVTTGMNALAHCVEGCYSQTANPVSTALAKDGAARLARGLRGLARGGGRDDLDELAAGTVLAGLCLLNARVGIGHAVCHVLGGRFGVPHGAANAVMLPAAMTFNLQATRAQQEDVVAAMEGLARDAAIGDPAGLVAALRDEIGAPRTLRDLGSIRRHDLDEIAERCLSLRGTYFNPRPVRSAADVRELLELAW